MKRVATGLLAGALAWSTAAASEDDFAAWERHALKVLESARDSSDAGLLESLKTLRRESLHYYQANRLDFLEAMLLERTGRTDEAQALYRRLSEDEIFGRHAAQARLYLLRTHAPRGEWVGEVMEFLAAWKGGEGADDLALDAARVASQGEPEDALTVLRKLRAMEFLPKKAHREIRRRIYEIELPSLDAGQAAGELLAVLRESATDDDAVFAVRVFDRYQQISPEYGEEILFLSAKAFYENRDFAEAETRLALFGKAFPDSVNRPESVFMLARSLEQQKRIDEACRLYEELKDDEFWGPRAYFRRMACLDERGDPAAALAVAAERLVSYPDGAFLEETLYRQAQILFKAGRSDEALNALRAIPAGGTLRFYERGLIEFALERYRAGDGATAAGILEEVLGKTPVNSYAEEAHYWLGRIARLEDRLDAAREHYCKVLDLNPLGYFADLIVTREDGLWRTPEETQSCALFEQAKRLRLPSAAPVMPASRVFPLVSHAIEAASFAEPAQRARYLDLLGRSDWAAQEWKSALEGGASLGMEELTEAADTAYRAEDYLLALRFAEKAFLRISAEKPFLGKLDSTVRRGLYPVPFPDILLRSACGQDIDPLLVASIMREESRFDPRAKSWAAARGLMQFIPPTARSVAQDLNIPWRGEDSLYDPETAILLGARHLRDLRARFKGDVQKAVAAYNAGEPAVRRWERSGAPDDDVDFLVRISYLETRNYVKRVLNSYAHYRAIYGDGLCARP